MLMEEILSYEELVSDEGVLLFMFDRKNDDKIDQYENFQMNNFELEKEELALIYGDNYKTIDKNSVSVSIAIQGRNGTVTFTVPEKYPDEIPTIKAKIEGASGAPLEKHLTDIAKTMAGLSMIAYLVGHAMTFLAGIPEKDFQVTQEQVSATPFSRENFLLWLKRFNEEMKPKEDQSLPPTGRQLFEMGLVN